MNSKRAILLLVCLIISIGIVLILFAASNGIRRQPGSFLRQFPPHPALEAGNVGIDYDSYYIAGGTDHFAYLGNYAAPLQLIIINTSTMDTSHVQLNIDGIEREKFWSARVKVDSPYFFLTDGAVPRIYRGSVNDWHGERFPFDNAYFLDFEPITPRSFAIRALGKPLAENILGIIKSASPQVTMKSGILKKQVDGIFCTDGTMHFNKARNEITYLYLYRNEYMVLDTSLNLLRTGHTLDTTNHADIKVEKIASTGQIKFAMPQHIVNRSSFSSGDFLFVNSMLVARNENKKAAEEATPIDVYRSGRYQFSFYIYNFRDNEKMKHFQVHNSKLYAIFSHHFQVWNLSPAYFQ